MSVCLFVFYLKCTWGLRSLWDQVDWGERASGFPGKLENRHVSSHRGRGRKPSPTLHPTSARSCPACSLLQSWEFRPQTKIQPNLVFKEMLDSKYMHPGVYIWRALAACLQLETWSVKIEWEPRLVWETPGEEAGTAHASSHGNTCPHTGGTVQPWTAVGLLIHGDPALGAEKKGTEGVEKKIEGIIIFFLIIFVFGGIAVGYFFSLFF